MKANTIKRSNHTGLVLMTAAVALVALAVGAVFCYDRLKSVCEEECVILDMSAQVRIETGKMIPAETIAAELGLKKGANLAEIDFAQKREELLARVPNLRSVKITRTLPDKVTVVVEERTPIARLDVRGAARVSGKVVDSEGVVFIRQRGTQMLPVIREPKSPGTGKGQRLQGRARAALRLVEACRDAELLELNVQEVDTSKHDFLTVTLGNYSKLKICWKDMDEPTPDSQADMVGRLTNLRNTIRSKVPPETTVIWNATLPDKIFADTQEKL